MINLRWPLYALLAAVGLVAFLGYKSQVSKRPDARLDIFNQSYPLDVADPANIGDIASDTPLFARPNLTAVDDWIEWQTTLRQYLSEKVYELKDAVAAGPAQAATDTHRSVDGNVTRIELWIQADDGHKIPAVLLLPDRTEHSPAILLIPGHVKDGESGLEQMTRVIESYHNSAALKLAQAGFATLTIELRGFGFLGPPNFPNHKIVAYNSLLAGHFYKKLAVQDIRYAFDYLLSRNEVDSLRVGMAGVSFGGELAVAYSGLDERVKAIAFHSYGGAVGAFKSISSSKAELPHYCHIVPGSKQLYRQEDTILLLAPRPTMGARGLERPIIRPTFLDTLRDTWAALEYPEYLDLVNLPGQSKFDGHAFFVDETIQFFNEHL